MIIVYKGRTCVSFSELVDRSVSGSELGKGVITLNQYKVLMREKRLEVARRGSRGNEALYVYESLPDFVKTKLSERYPQGVRSMVAVNMLNQYYHYDTVAYNYYDTHEFGLSSAQVKRYTANASAIQAVIGFLNMQGPYRQSRGGSKRGASFELILNDLKSNKKEWGHSLPASERGLRRAINRFKNEHYDGMIPKTVGNQNASKTADERTQALLRRICNNYNNLDDQQIADLFNQFVKVHNETIGYEEWKTITRQTVANFREKNQVYVDAGSRGEGHHNNTHAMQVTRFRPTGSLKYWTLDGWDVELLYQSQRTDKKGKTVTTYHNRLNVVIVLDPSCDYIVGYHISDTETKFSIKSALRNALNHVRDLFGTYYIPHQLQSDNFSRGGLRGFYEAITDKYTPARVGNAKSKVIEPFFKAFNKRCQLERNWSGHGVTSRKENQPNAEYLNNTAVKHRFPDREEAILQLEQIIQEFRFRSVASFSNSFEKEQDKIMWTREQFLFHLGETTGYTNKLEGSGINVTLDGVRMKYDTFEQDFRLKHRKEDWIVKYDPEDKEQILVHDADGRVRFLLDEKYQQPMALEDRKEGDAEELQKVFDFNKKMKNKVIEVAERDMEILNELAQKNKRVEETLSKVLITDSLGQHKTNKQQARIAAAADLNISQINKMQEKEKRAVEIERRREYLDNKVNADVLNDLYGI